MDAISRIHLFIWQALRHKPEPVSVKQFSLQDKYKG
jgi:hypothetical protein